MSRILYSTKLYLLQENFQLTTEELKDLEDFCLFGAVFYMPHWLQTPYLSEAAKNDFEYFKNLKVFQKVNETSGLELQKKFISQSWYLGPELVGFSLFSSEVSLSTKKNIVKKLNSEKTSEWNIRKVKASLPTLKSAKTLGDFVDDISRSVLEKKIVGMKDLLKLDVELWSRCPIYKNAQKIINESYIPINDAAERNVHMASTYNDYGSKNEQEKQIIFQNVANHRQNLRDANKKTLKNFYNN